MRVKRLVAVAAIGLVAGLLHRSVGAQEPASLDMIAAIKAEGLTGSEAPALFHNLTDE